MCHDPGNLEILVVGCRNRIRLEMPGLACAEILYMGMSISEQVPTSIVEIESNLEIREGTWPFILHPAVNDDIS